MNSVSEDEKRAVKKFGKMLCSYNNCDSEQVSVSFVFGCTSEMTFFQALEVHFY